MIRINGEYTESFNPKRSLANNSEIYIKVKKLNYKVNIQLTDSTNEYLIQNKDGTAFSVGYSMFLFMIVLFQLLCLS